MAGQPRQMQQKYFMTPETMSRIRDKAWALLDITGRCPVRAVASAKGLIASTWVSTGSAANLSTRALGWVVESRTGFSKASWTRFVTLTSPAIAELIWWASNLELVNGQDIIPSMTSGFFDGKGINDASNTGYGGWISSKARPGVSCLLVQRLQAGPHRGYTLHQARHLAEEGIEMVGQFPPYIANGSSTLRELFGVWMYFVAFASLMQHCLFLLGLDNICCVFILGGVLQLSATGNKEPKSTPCWSQIP